MPPKRSSVKRPSFDQPIIHKRRNLSLAETPNVAPANPSPNPPAIFAANPPNRLVTVEDYPSLLSMEPETNLSSWTHDREFRERNKNLRHIYEEEGLHYGEDASAAELNKRMARAVKLRQASVAKIFRMFNSSRHVQFCFLVDITGSMGKHIDGVRDSIFKIVEKLTENHVTLGRISTIAKKVSLAFVGYRDFGLKNPFELLPFTESVKKFRIPFAHGEERKVFYGRDLTGNIPIDIVLKEYIRNNTDNVGRSAAVPYEIATQMQTIAAYLASVFGDRLAKKGGNLQKGEMDLSIKFLKGQLLSIEINPGEYRYMSCERRYGKDTKFLRFSNNADYEMLESTCNVNNLSFDVVELLMAFSHWTYQISGGYLMVVDLQGIKSTDENGRTTLELTDPAIHCTDVLRFGRTNLSKEGMERFFARHKCNKFCQGMELEEHVATTS
ncbi:alpha-kinase family domain-containing protein [Ditylenchus destructor]|uniref:Alpha-kinase family domain-containing protein n=1 Tax=Ditylenchus destructor TaxID=166010 RepID=A0AAD4QXB5_9BILA|nr:alpha-kinase family domain-containing protein [Ditylenchus destructor]